MTREEAIQDLIKSAKWGINYHEEKINHFKSMEHHAFDKDVLYHTNELLKEHIRLEKFNQ